jgi:hypothetical protein
MDKKMQSKRTLPALSLHIQIKPRYLAVRLVIQARWAAATLIILVGVLMGSDILPRLLDALPKLLK